MVRLIFILSLLGFTACATTKPKLEASNGERYAFEYVPGGSEGQSCVKGKLYNELGEALIGAKIWLEDTSGNFKAGAATGFEGNFRLCIQGEGTHKLKVEYIGYESQEILLDLHLHQILIFNDTLKVEEVKIELLKPLIYLYPEDTMDVKVELAVEGELKHTYPRYTKGWEVTAHPNGTLYDARGRSYYGLYWEADTYQDMSFSTGFVVAKEELIPFLEEKLAVLGLSEREANEFIMYWLPVLEKNALNAIHFSTDVYSDLVPLNITPQPDQIIRVMMLYTPLTQAIDLPLQPLQAIQRSEEGFIVVEWGGAKVNFTPIEN